MKKWLTACVLLLLTVSPAMGLSLDDRVKAFNEPGNEQSEAQVAALLKAGFDERRSAEALAAVQPWLNRNAPTTPQAQFYAGQAAEYAGNWLAAIGYYQRLLQSPKPDPKLAGPAIDATYRLLLSALGDEQAAYLYMRKDGNRLRGFGQAKRYDRWFLAQAQRQSDYLAYADRLATIASDKSTDQELFTKEFGWLCDQMEQFRKQSDEVYAAVQRVAEAPRTPKLVKARLNWFVSVMRYNHKLDELRNANAPADPKLTDAPLAAAAALIKLSPDYAITVAKGWGTEYDHGHSGNCQKRFNIEGKRKLDQLLAAASRMSAEQRDDLFAFRIAQGRVKLDLLDVYELVIKHPESFNTLDAARVPLFDKSKLTVELAKDLAPHLARNPHPEAAMIRAIATSGSLEASKIAEALLNTEAWRFASNKDAVNAAWSASTTQDIEHKALHSQYAQPDPRREKLANQVAKKVAGPERIAAFNTLYQDLLSPAPTIPGALVLWDELFTHASDGDDEAMFKELVKDTRGPRGLLLKRALAKAGFGKKNAGKMWWQAEVYDNQFRFHRAPVQAALPGLIAHLQTRIASQAKAGSIDPLVFGMWLHTVDPKQEGAIKLMQQLVTSPAYLKLNPAYHESVADHHHFGLALATPAIATRHPSSISRELLALPEDASPKAVESALSAVVKRVAAQPEPVALMGLEPVAKLPEWSDKTRSLVLSLFRDYAPLGAYPSKQGYEPLLERLADEAREQQHWHELEPYLAGMWRAAEAKDHHRHEGVPRIVKLAESAAEAGHISIALSIARSGLSSRVGESLIKSNDEASRQWAGRLSQLRGKASIDLGIIDIPVDERNPSYPIYQSQAEFAVGNTAAAWELYDKNAEQLKPIVRQLTVPYCLWLLEREIAAQESTRAEVLIRELTVWSREAAGTFTASQEAELKIAYADAAFQKGALQTAKAWYRRVADAEEYKGTALQHRAILRSVAVDRASKDFDSAMSELDQLILVRDDELRKQVHYARAEVYFDQESYAEAFAEVSTVLKRDPGHADALILLGKAQLEMRKLVDASEIELGVSRDQKLVVPGETIKINLSDPALNISGVGADIEVEIWTKSGDRERVLLYQLGDDKTKFRAEVPTRLGPRTPGDKVLQLLGRDEIRYGYSKRFRDKMTDLPPDPEVVITVASDARLSVSAGAFPPREGERLLDLQELGVSGAQQALGTRRVRPGNPVYLRVIDPDQSKTDSPDQIIASVQTSSGDVIPRLVLRETGPNTGEFEAAVPTGRAQALAFASESAPGRDPNMVISAEPYPGWAGAVGSEADRQTFTIDLNDNVELGEMVLSCDDPAQTLTHFVLQTSMNGSDWVSRARFPTAASPWDGSPQITGFPTYGRDAIPLSPLEGFSVPDDWREAMEVGSASANVAYRSISVTGLTDLNLDLPPNHPGATVVIRYRAVFYQPAAAIRTFRLTGLPIGEKAQTLFLINGEPADADADDPMTIERELGPGLHTIEVWRQEVRGELLKRKPRLLQNVAGEEALQPCPDAMFDPATFPEAARRTLAKPALIAASGESPGRFDVSFGAGTRARMVRLAIVGHAGPAPAIKTITLADQQGRKRLPVPTDYQKLRANDRLEVVPGDQVVVRYEDDRVVTPNRAIQQGRLSVAYNTATISASFLTYVQTEEGRELVLEPIRRFKIDDSVGIVINDPDLDQTREPDQVRFTVRSSDGSETNLIALETGPQTGEFLGRVFPVTGQPQREAEIRVPEGGTITAIYRDEENLSPGIPTNRMVTIEHARFSRPVLAVYDTDTSLLPVPDASDQEAIDEERGPEIVRPRHALSFRYRDPQAAADTQIQVVIGSSLRFDVLASHLAFAESSEIVAYVQTSSGRKKQAAAGRNGANPFDIGVPGTLKLRATPSRSAPTLVPPGYLIASGALAPTIRPPLEEGRFAFSVPLVLDDTPLRSYANKSAEALPSSMLPDALAVRPGDTIHIGFAYLDPQGEPQWLTTTVELASHAMLDVMNNRYRRSIDAAFVGEKLYVLLIAPHLDLGPERDTARVTLHAESGAGVAYELLESEPHSGVFKGSFALSFASGSADSELPPVALNGLPVKYGDKVTIAYRGSGSDAPPPHTVRVNKGADGIVEPFTKRYGEDAIAIQTTFTLAECYFELAKYHGKMDQESLARRKLGQAQKLLGEAIESHRDEAMQAHAEYLLGNLAQEYADLSKNQAAKKLMYQDALARFSKIPLDYPETEFAPKAQFKKALVYEKLGEVDIAVEEYVKLAYKYPDHELIPSVMSRLGAYFQSQGLAFKEQAQAIEEQEQKTAEEEGEIARLRELMTKEYLNAARVFKKLQERFPNDELAGLAGLRSAQNFMRAGDFADAIVGFQKVVDTEIYDDKTVRSQALFWMGISHERLDDHREAYQVYRRVTFDFPDSVWAKQSRGRLADPVFVRIIEQEELARERMLEALKEQNRRR